MGATAVINGIYDPMPNEKSQDGRVRYRKRDDVQMYIEHHEGTWDVKASTHLGTNSCKATILGGCRLELCVARDWQVADGGVLKVQKNVNLTFGAEAERIQVKTCSICDIFDVLSFKHRFSTFLTQLQPLPSPLIHYFLLPRKNAKLKPPKPKRRSVLCCRVFGSSMPRDVLYAPRALHSSRCLHLTAGCCRRPHCRQTRHPCCSAKWRPCSSSGSRDRRCFLRRPPRQSVRARWQLFHALFKPNSVCASSFFRFPSVKTPH